MPIARAAPKRTVYSTLHGSTNTRSYNLISSSGYQVRQQRGLSRAQHGVARVIDQIEESVEFIKKNLHARFEITGEPQRKELWDYPLPVLREAVINAICHRDYGDVADIQIKIFENSLQVWSPGYLPYDVTVDDLFDPEHTSKPRNKLIAQIFYDMRLIERYGSGISRILDGCQEAGLPKPFFENFSGGFRIKFMSTTPITGEVTRDEGGSEGVNEGVNALLAAIRTDPGHRLPFYADKLDTPAKTVEHWLQRLRDEKQVEFRGAPKTGGYYATDG